MTDKIEKLTEKRLYMNVRREIEPLIESYLPVGKRAELKISIREIVLAVIRARKISKKTYTQIFMKELPYFLQYGMSEKQVREAGLAPNNGIMEHQVFMQQLEMFITYHEFYRTHNTFTKKKKGKQFIKTYHIDFDNERMVIDIQITQP